jgi:hypothetical protein
MRLVWAIAAAVLLAAVAVIAWPRAGAPAATTPATPVGTPVATPTADASPTEARPAPAAPVPPPAAATNAPASTPLTVGAPAVVERLDERTVRLDGRWTIRGSGTESDPYDLTWDLLGSARGGIDAAAMRYELPGRLADLRGAWVRISGYWAPPVQAFEAREVLLMLNKWDGCCIGLPPTPFDSIEVSLAKPVAVQGQHVFRYGAIRGRLAIEPFAAGGFLLGLYRLTDATLESSS